METFESMYAEIENKIGKSLNKRKTLQSKTFFLTVVAVCLSREAKTCKEVIKEHGEWNKLPKNLSDFLTKLEHLCCEFEDDSSSPSNELNNPTIH